LEGAMGLPVFSPHGPGGMAQLLGPTGGYLLSYPFVAALPSLLYRRGGRRLWAALGSGLLASLLIVACGFVWLAVVTHAAPWLLFTQSIAPFLPGDTVQVLAAALCAGALGSFRENSRNRTL